MSRYIDMRKFGCIVKEGTDNPIYDTAYIMDRVVRNKDRAAVANMIKNWRSISPNTDIAFDSIIKTLVNINHTSNPLVPADYEYFASLISTNLVGDMDNASVLSYCDVMLEDPNNDSLIKGMLIYIRDKSEEYKKNMTIQANDVRLNSAIHLETYIGRTKMAQSKFYAREGIYELSHMIYNKYKSSVPVIKRYGVCIENLLYKSINRNLKITNQEVLETITECFLAKEITNDDLVLMHKAVSLNNFYTESEKITVLANLERIMLNEGILSKPNQAQGDIVFEGDYSDILNKDIQIKEAVDKESIKDLMNTLQDKGENVVDKIKPMMTKIYAKPLHDVVDETPFILGFVRRLVLIGGTFVINPYLGVVVGLVDFFVEQELTKEQATKVIKSLEKEKAHLETKLDTAKDEVKIKGYKEGIETLNKKIMKMNQHLENQMSEKERDKHLGYSEASLAIYNNLISLQESAEMYINEGDVKDVLTIARENIKKGFDKLSSKEKGLSRQLDSSLDGVSKGLDKSLTVDKREAIVKGKMIPSASQAIKIAVLVGAAWAVNPVIAIVGSLGTFAVSKACTERERKLILDEIEIELEIVDRKVRQAEMNNDDKAYEELLRLKQRLTREKQRIKYNAKVYWRDSGAQKSSSIQQSKGGSK